MRLPKLMDKSFSLLFHSLTIRNVSRKASRVNEIFVLPKDIGRGENRLDGAILRPQTRFVIFERLLPA